MTTTCPTANREVQRPNDTTIRYVATGPADGPVLVLVHGWGCDRTDFDALIGFLPGHHRVLAVDLAGHGESRSAREDWTMAEFARDVAAVLAAESVDTCVVAGHSMGGAVAVETARLLPAVVTRVVALDALHYLSLFPAQEEQQADAVVRAFHEDFAAATRAMVASGSPEGTDPAAQEAYFERMVAVPRQVGLGAIEALVRWDMDSALRDAHQPITVFAVREILARDAVDRYGDRLRIVPVDLGSHHFHVESPKATAALLADA